MSIHRNGECDVRGAEKITLSLNEVVALTGIGEKELVELARKPNCQLIIYIGAKRMFKRRQLQEYLESNYSV